MAAGLVALLDDVASIAKVAAASLDDVVGQAARTSVKSAGVLIDDAAVTPKYVVGFAADRELPIIARIAKGSLKNKLLFLLPIALLLSLFAPWAITPLLMLGGSYLCFEGAEKIYEKLSPHHEHPAEEERDEAPKFSDPKALEDAKVASAIRTDFVLSAEIMAISLASIPEGSFWMRAAVLALVALTITTAVYGAVAVIVKADDVGLRLAQSERKGLLGSLLRGYGRTLVKSMPHFLNGLTIVGTLAMLWVGGGIVVHGMEELGIKQPGHFIHHLAESAGHAVPRMSGFVEWFVSATGSGIFGLLYGFLLIPIVTRILIPLSRKFRKTPGPDSPTPGTEG